MGVGNARVCDEQGAGNVSGCGSGGGVCGGCCCLVGKGACACGVYD